MRLSHSSQSECGEKQTTTVPSVNQSATMESLAAADEQVRALGEGIQPAEQQPSSETSPSEQVGDVNREPSSSTQPASPKRKAAPPQPASTKKKRKVNDVSIKEIALRTSIPFGLQLITSQSTISLHMAGVNKPAEDADLPELGRRETGLQEAILHTRSQHPTEDWWHQPIQLLRHVAGIRRSNKHPEWDSFTIDDSLEGRVPTALAAKQSEGINDGHSVQGVGKSDLGFLHSLEGSKQTHIRSNKASVISGKILEAVSLDRAGLRCVNQETKRVTAPATIQVTNINTKAKPRKRDKKLIFSTVSADDAARVAKFRNLY
jgi:hypothetical protein